MAPKKEFKEKEITEKGVDVGKGFQELEEITAWFEQGDTDLDKGLAKFERAMVIAGVLKKRLALAENSVKEIQKKHNLE